MARAFFFAAHARLLCCQPQLRRPRRISSWPCASRCRARHMQSHRTWRVAYGHATSRDGWIYRNLYIDPPLMTALLRGLDWRTPLEVRFKLPLVNDAILAGRLAHAFASLNESNSLLQNESLLLSVVARLATDHLVPGQSLPEPEPEPAAVRRIREWLDAHPEQNVSVHSLAEIAGLSSYYLVRVFHKHVGIPPHQYQKNVRVLKARKLLTAGATISEVAYLAGFCDQSHLNRCFKTTLGVTPGRYVTHSSERPARGHSCSSPKSKGAPPRRS
jgi:AraC-like DNA-binding protein